MNNKNIFLYKLMNKNYKKLVQSLKNNSLNKVKKDKKKYV